jgi:hypothetical protein
MRSLFKIVLGLLIGLAVSEAAFWLRDAGAFPHVNFYEADPVLGAKLRPQASMRISFAGNPVSTITTNTRGFRGDEWPAQATGETIIVGDSQVFGLGVNDDETFSAKLHALNAGVPTYGPIEYTTLVERLVAERKPKNVVYVLNVANDLFELERPNTLRHAVWDGWAVRKEAAPTSVTPFPLRGFLMSQSHLFYAARRLWNDTSTSDLELASEGTWKDLSAEAQTTTLPKEAASEDQKAKLQERMALTKTLSDLGLKIESRFVTKQDDPNFAKTAKTLAKYEGNASDILVNRYAEAARPVNATAAQLFIAALHMDANDVMLRELADKSQDQELRKALDERRALRQKLRELTGAAPSAEPQSAALDRMLQRTKAACDAHGARLLVVALPLDVQVSSDEWLKYGVKPIDLASTRVLLSNIVARAELAGASGLDLTQALQQAEPGVFFKGDLHLTQKGHAVVATSIEAALARPPKERDILPAGRSLMPTHAEWVAASENLVTGSTAAHCVTKLVREWLRVQCQYAQDLSPSGVMLTEGGHGDAIVHGGRGNYATLIAPIMEGDQLRARFGWENKTGRELRVDWPNGGQASMRFSEPDKSFYVSTYGPQSLYAKVDLYGDYVDPRCKNDASLECRLDSGLNAPKCTEQEIRYGVLRRCAPKCAPNNTCKVGHCLTWGAHTTCVEP